MRIPQPRMTNPVNTSRVVQGGGVQPQHTRAAGGTTGSQGTPGSIRRKPGTAGRPVILGQEVYLWVFVLIEASLTGVLRRYFRRFHGG